MSKKKKKKFKLSPEQAEKLMEAHDTIELGKTILNNVPKFRESLNTALPNGENKEIKTDTISELLIGSLFKSFFGKDVEIKIEKKEK